VDFNKRPETLKQFQEEAGNTLEQIGIAYNFLNGTQKVLHLGERMNKWNCIILKNFYIAKETVTRLKGKPIEWEKIFAIYSADKGLISRIFREFKKLSPQRINTPMKK
jgi:hypothetical protein